MFTSCLLLKRWDIALKLGTYQKLINGKHILKIRGISGYILLKYFAPLKSMLECGQKIR